MNDPDHKSSFPRFMASSQLDWLLMALLGDCPRSKHSAFDYTRVFYSIYSIFIPRSSDLLPTKQSRSTKHKPESIDSPSHAVKMSVVETSMHFLTRDDLYEREKPYQFRYDVADGIPRTNLRHVKQEPLKIHNMRGREEQFSFEKNGFTVLELDEEIPYDDFDDPAGIRRYLDIVAKQLRLKLNADTVQVYQYLVSVKSLNHPPKNVLLTTARFGNAT